jgi:hypothetical protein
MLQYTMHFQKYPGDHSKWFQQMRGCAPKPKVILLGNAAGFEAEINSLRSLGIEIDDRTDPDL